MANSSQPSDFHHPSLTQEEFDVIAKLVYELTGISLNDSKRVLVESRLARRLRALGLATYREYYERLKRDPGAGEMTEFINSITTNKTDFFREPHHFEFLRREVLPAAERRAQKGAPRKFRIWSAACSSGEEPYTLAMTVREHFARGSGWDVRILATDIDTDVLARAKRGIYAADRIDGIPSELRNKYLLRGKGEFDGQYRVRPELQELIEFRQLNFMNAEWHIDGTFDVIFCRNVVIYFDRVTQEKLFRRFHGMIVDDGHLIIGHSESLHFLPELYTPLRNTIYQRRRAGATSSGPIHPALRAPAAPLPAALPAPMQRAAPPPMAWKSSTPAAALPYREPALSAATSTDGEPEIRPKTITIGDVYSSDKPAAVRTVLGSCVAACLWDPITRIGGMNHILLPSNGGTGTESASSYGVNAMELLINALMKLGAERKRIRAKVFGAAHVLQAVSSVASVPEKNAAFIQSFLEKESIPIVGKRLGGTLPLEVIFHTHTGKALVRTVGGKQTSDLVNAEREYGLQIVRKVQAPTDENITLF